jgi:hypothetical protein
METAICFVTSLPKKFRKRGEYKGRFPSPFTTNKLETLFGWAVNVRRVAPSSENQMAGGTPQ